MATSGIDPHPEREPQLLPAPPALVPAWHTVVLIAAIAALSIHSASKLSLSHAPINRLATYGFSALMEALMLAWVCFGLWLKKISFRSLLGFFPFNLRSIALDLCVAAAFWIGALMVLGTLSLAWSVVELSFTHTASPIASREKQNLHSAQPGETKKVETSGATQPAGQLNPAASALANDPERLEELRAVAQFGAPPTEEKQPHGHCSACWSASLRSLSFAATCNASSSAGRGATGQPAYAYPR